VRLALSERAWAQYLYWQENDRRLLRRINDLIRECMRTPFSGRAKPEPLRGELAGYWSRRIDQEHRLVYKVADDTLVIVQCRYHY
jgi:toxin YoeB